jgi:hypothetical protein
MVIETRDDDAVPTQHFLDGIYHDNEMPPSDHQRRDLLMFLSTRDRIELAAVMLFLIAAEIALIIGQGAVAAEQLECGATSTVPLPMHRQCDWDIIRFKVSFVVIGAIAKAVIEFLFAWLVRDAVKNAPPAFLSIVTVIWCRFPHLCAASIAQTIGMLTMGSMHNETIVNDSHIILHWNIVTYLFGYAFVAIFIVMLTCCIIGGMFIRKRMHTRALQSRSPPPGMPTARGDVVMVM